MTYRFVSEILKNNKAIWTLCNLKLIRRTYTEKTQRVTEVFNSKFIAAVIHSAEFYLYRRVFNLESCM
jgi:hypothetical protein